MPDNNIEILRKESYLKAIENSVGSKIFNSLIVRFKDTGKITDVLAEGVYSCAFFVSSLLYLSKTTDKPYSTVTNLQQHLDKKRGWNKVEDIEPGDVIFWEKITFEDGSENAHVGFALNKSEAVSTDYKNKMVARHQLQSDRKITGIYRYSWPKE